MIQESRYSTLEPSESVNTQDPPNRDRPTRPATRLIRRRTITRDTVPMVETMEPKPERGNAEASTPQKTESGIVERGFHARPATPWPFVFRKVGMLIYWRFLHKNVCMELIDFSASQLLVKMDWKTPLKPNPWERRGYHWGEEMGASLVYICQVLLEFETPVNL